MRSNIVIKNYYRNPNCKSGRTTSGCAVISLLKTITETPTAKVAELLLDAIVEPLLDAIVEPLLDAIVEPLLDAIVEPLLDAIVEPLLDAQ